MKPVRMLIVVMTSMLLLISLPNFHFGQNLAFQASPVNTNSITSSATYMPGKISIDDTNPAKNWSKTAQENPWCYGNGTYEMPYVIENCTIDGGGSGSCIEIQNSNVYFIIRNCIIYNAGGGVDDAGIRLYRINNSQILNNNCSNNGYSGILLDDPCFRNTIANNLLSNTGPEKQKRGLRVVWGRYNLIRQNTAINNADYGIELLVSSNNTITNNILSNEGTTYQGVGLHLFDICDNNTISGNIVKKNTVRGIYLDIDCDYNTIINNTCSNDATTLQDTGIYFNAFCNFNTIRDNILINNTYSGIELYRECNRNLITNNIASNQGYQDYGVVFSDRCLYNTIANNTITGNIAAGIYLYDRSNFTVICGNIIARNYRGIRLSGVRSTDITKNRINESSFYGVIIEGTSNFNDVLNNLITKNGNFGILVQGDGHYFYRNVICKNNDGRVSNQTLDAGVNNVWIDNIFNCELDTDGDGLLNYVEISLGTDLFVPDTDADNLEDGFEVNLGTNPLVKDTDNDGLTDYTEIFIYSTNATKVDTDGDGLSDGNEVTIYLTNPILTDTDGDGLADSQELGNTTNPRLADTDADNLEDGFEVNLGTDPLVNDTDNDGLTDYEEIFMYSTNATKADTDGDNFSDAAEIAAGTNPLDIKSYPGAPAFNLMELILLVLIGILIVLVGILIVVIGRSRKPEQAPTSPSKVKIKS